MTLRLSELFYSIQGEGSRAGRPSIFIRLAGCNLHCSWCDTPYAINPNNSLSIDSSFLVELFTKNNWFKLLGKQGNTDLVITGGEPMLQQHGIVELLQEFNAHNVLPTTSMESNGTIPIQHSELVNLIDTMTVSPKLANSGMSLQARYKPEVLRDYIRAFTETNFKFVIYREEDLREVIVDFFLPLDLHPSNIWLMPAGRTQAELAGRVGMVVELCKDYGFNYSPRLHIDIWNGEHAK